MSDATPSIEIVRARYHLATLPDDAPQWLADRSREQNYAEFDRWLASVIAQKRAEWENGALDLLISKREPVAEGEREALARAQWDDPVNVITWDELTEKAERDEADYREIRQYALDAAERGIAAGFRRIEQGKVNEACEGRAPWVRRVWR